jgi:hypothetical protein
MIGWTEPVGGIRSVASKPYSETGRGGPAFCLLVLFLLFLGAAAPPAPRYQSPAEAAAKSAGCISCHTASDAATMHPNPAVILGCTDCHGGSAAVSRPSGATISFGASAARADGLSGHAPAVARNPDAAYRIAMDAAHVAPLHPEHWGWPASARPERSYTALNHESQDFIRFLNPADYRIDRQACGACHKAEIQQTERSLMATGAMLWGGAAYNNGIVPFKHYVLGEAYTADGLPGKIFSPLAPDGDMTARGILPSLSPLPRWEVTPPGDIFRIFERGGRIIGSQFPDIGNPNETGELQRLDEPGRPDFHASNRGAGTGARISVPLINIHKTRLNDPTTWFLGTDDQPGDYRSSGCASCHVVYSNDADPAHSGPYAAFGHDGASHTVDPTIPHGESGHPLKHVFTKAVPTSQCMVCHMHQPNVFVNSFLGYTMWDYESDAPRMWPAKQVYPSSDAIRAVNARNPEGAAPRGKWADVEFLAQVAGLNPQMQNTQFADYHGHGWNFRAVYKQDRKGNLLDAAGRIVPHTAPDKFQRAVHLASIHMEKGMQCVDCHFAQDMHGNGFLYGEVSAAIEIQCADCHGTVDRYPALRTSGPAAQPGGRDLSTLRNEDGSLRFTWRDGHLIQRSAVTPGLAWDVSLVRDTVDPANARYNPRAARAKLMSTGWSQNWGPGVAPADRAHKDSDMMCITCHTSWTTSCSGCHLPIEANWKSDRQHFEGGATRNFATYNPQVARDDIFSLGRNSSVKNNIIAPIRSSSALVQSSTNINREHIYVQQPPIAASGYSSQAFAPHYPHTERTVETKTCDDCHVSAKDDNNAIMAQLLLLGTNFVNFVGYNAWLGERDGVEAVQVTEWDEPQAVIGSYLQRYAYPDYFQRHLARGRELATSIHHGGDVTSCVQLRGEYLYTAAGSDGLRVYDVAAIANKGVSEKILTGPVSPLGQNTHVDTQDATCLALPTNQSIAPLRNDSTLMRLTNQEQPIHPLYNYVFVTDAREGLIAVDVNALTDGEPRNNYLRRAMTWNQDGVLTGARHITIAGTIFYITTDRNIVVLDMNQPLQPRVAAVINLSGARATALQFRYLFVAAADGLHVVDVTTPSNPEIVSNATVPLRDARRVYVARTFAYVADGADGLAMIDVEKPRAPRLYTLFNASGQIRDASDVVVGSTNASLFAYVADGAGGLKVLQLTSPASQPGFYGFSPDPKPELIAWRHTASPALAVSKGLDRDRGVDETGHQIAVFGRLGSRPFTLPEMQKLYLDDGGLLHTVTNSAVAGFLPAASGPAAKRPGPIFRRPGAAPPGTE